MPTLHPRLSITLTPEGQQALRRLSAAGGGSQSSIVADLLQMAAPTLERVATVLELASRAQGSARESLRADLVGSQAAMERQLGTLTGELDRLLGVMGEARPGDDTSAPRAGEAADGNVSTPFSNRGVTPPPRVRHRPSKSAGGKS